MTGSKARILIVDDQKTNTRLIAGLLAAYRCEAAASGPEALAMLDEFMPDLILLDVLMPEMDGLSGV